MSRYESRSGLNGHRRIPGLSAQTQELKAKLSTLREDVDPFGLDSTLPGEILYWKGVGDTAERNGKKVRYCTFYPGDPMVQQRPSGREITSLSSCRLAFVCVCIFLFGVSVSVVERFRA